MKLLRFAMTALSFTLASSAYADPSTPIPPRTELSGVPSWLEGFRLTGYLQFDGLVSQASRDEVVGATPANEDRFYVRRARLRVERKWEWADAAIELDGNTTSGPSVGLRRAEASVFLQGPQPKCDPPLLRLTAGLTEIPFGRETSEPNRVRYFLERSQTSLALFPGEPDIGIRFLGAAGVFRWAFGLYDGTPLDNRTGGLNGRDLVGGKDLLARVGIETPARSNERFIAGISALHGTGLHVGSDATSPSLAWKDKNGNGLVDAGELVGTPASPAIASETFRRWVVGADLEFSIKTSIGLTRIYGEIYYGANADRSTAPADPIKTGHDLRELGYFGAVLQELGRWAVVGLRVDLYSSDLDYARNATSPPKSDPTILTISPLIGFVWAGHGRLLLQYDRNQDLIGRDSRGKPIDLPNDRLTARLQAEL